jgi:4'-phosphopantetheinyl transferase
MLRLFLTQADEWLSHEILSERMTALPENIRTDILSFKRQQDATLSYLGKQLVSHGFKELGLAFSWKDVFFNDHGRPCLDDPSYDFNISHSGEKVVIIIGTGKVGVDIEKHRNVDLSLFNRQFSEKEWLTIHQSMHPQKRFFELWSIKEAAIKADGRGVSILSKTQTESDAHLSIEDAVWYYVCPPAGEDYSLCVVSNTPMRDEDVVVSKVSPDDLYLL